MDAGFYWAKRTPAQSWELVEVRVFNGVAEVATMGWDIADKVSDYCELVPANLLDPSGIQH